MSGIPKHAASKDANKDQVVALMQKLGIATLDLKEPADLLIAKRFITVVVEIKDGEKDPSKRRLTTNERKFYDRWPGLYAVVENDQDVLDLHDSMALGLKSTAKYCEENMKAHFANNYRKKGIL